MKTTVIFSIFGLCFSALAEVIYYAPDTRGINAQLAESAATMQAIEMNEAAKQAALAEIASQKGFVPKDPWRVLGGVTNYAKPGFLQFEGEVLGVHPNGVRLRGKLSKPGVWPDTGTVEFFVRGFPYQVVDGQYLEHTSRYTARRGAVEEYTTVLGASRSLMGLDYGTVVWLSVTKEQQAAADAAAQAARDAAAEKKRKAGEAALKYHQDLAAKGDEYGLLRMGERYATGDGVPQDKAQAKALLTQAAAIGNKDAQAALSRLGL